MRQNIGRGVWGPPKVPSSSDLKDAKSSILAAYFPSSVIITFYDLMLVFSTLPGKTEYFEIHVHKKRTKLTRWIKSNCINISGNTSE